MNVLDNLPLTAAAIQDGIERGLHTAVQLYVSRDAMVLADAAMGDARPGVPLDRDGIMPWRSAGKPLTALLILREIERGTLSLDSVLADILPSAAETNKAAVSVRQLLTHEAGFPTADTGWPNVSWQDSVQRILNAPLQYPPGTAAYHPQASWFLLGEMLVALDSAKRTFTQILDDELLSPLAMMNSYCGVPADAVTEEVPELYERVGGQMVRSSLTEGVSLSQPSPGGNLRGPVRELGRFYELMLRRGTLADGTVLVRPESVDVMTARHRVGRFDQTFQHIVDYGLGVIVDSNHTGAGTVPYGFGRYCSSQTYGHGGAQCSIAFCDPAHRLVVAWSANGFCGEGQHQRRNRAINEAVYQDLGLA